MSAKLREIFDYSRFFEGEKPMPGAITLNQRRIFILPNQRGLGLGMLLLVQLLASINYNNSLGFILTFLIGSVSMTGAVYGVRNLAGLRLSAGRPEPVFVGEAAQFRLRIENPTAAPRIALRVGLRIKATQPAPRTGLRALLRLGPRTQYQDGPTQRCNALPGETAQILLPVATKKRGWLELPTVTLSTAFPLGIFRTWSPNRFGQRVLVYPRPAPDSQPFPTAGGGEGGQRRASSDDFHGFQSYQPGDPLRRIHWKGVAKGQGVHVKEYRGEESVELYLDWAHTPGYDTEARISRLCRWVLDAEQAGAAYGLRLPGTDLKPASGPAHLRQCLERLALFGL